MTADQKPTTPETTPEASNMVINSPQNPPIMENKLQVEDKKPTDIVVQISNDKEATIRNKRGYKIFLKLIKENKFTSAYATSKMLGIRPETAIRWMNTKPAIEAMQSKIDQYVSKIEASTDWKAQAYLFDKIMPNEDKPSTAIQIIMPSLQDTQGQLLTL